MLSVEPKTLCVKGTRLSVLQALKSNILTPSVCAVLGKPCADIMLYPCNVMSVPGWFALPEAAMPLQQGWWLPQAPPRWPVDCLLALLLPHHTHWFVFSLLLAALPSFFLSIPVTVDPGPSLTYELCTETAVH